MHWTLGHRLCILYILIRPVVASPVKALTRNELVEVETVGEAFIRAGTRTFVKYIDFVGVNTQLETLLERLQAMNPSGHSRGFTKIFLTKGFAADSARLLSALYILSIPEVSLRLRVRV